MRMLGFRAGVVLALGCAATAGHAQTPAEDVQAGQDTAAARRMIWSLEQAIYAGRSRGDASVYARNTAKGYMAWPPTLAQPMQVDRFPTHKADPAQSHEKLTMELVDFTLHGDTAIIYYRTHRTMRADGTPADDRFEVTHTWVRENGQWRVLGGMARAKALP